MNFFVTGLPKAGKTTLLHRLITELKSRGLKVGGFISPEERHHGTRTAFYAMSVESGKKSLLAAVKGSGPKISKYHVDVKSFESIAIPSLEWCEEYDVIIVDEIGWMELKSQKFADALDKVLDSDTPLIASLHMELVGKYGAYGEVYELRTDNHELVYDELLEKIEKIRKKPEGLLARIISRKHVKKAVAKKKAGPKKVTKKAKPMKKGLMNHIKKLLRR